jgi:hypothetical protein
MNRLRKQHKKLNKVITAMNEELGPMDTAHVLAANMAILLGMGGELTAVSIINKIYGGFLDGNGRGDTGGDAGADETVADTGERSEGESGARDAVSLDQDDNGA